MTDNTIKNIKDLTLSEISLFAVENGFESYRGKQVFADIYKNRRRSFFDIVNIPSDLKQVLADNFKFDSISSHNVQYSSDGTIKFLFKLFDGNSIESVLIPSIENSEDPELKRNTLCVSSQVGCALGCVFCATGKLKLTRNLKPGEIVDQVLKAEEITGSKITNIVFMGMGEPLQNLTNVIKSIDILSHKDSLVVNRKKITVSTSGIVPKINELASIDNPVKLALSLHSTTNGVRSKLMPIAEKWDLSSLRNAIIDYYTKTKIPITYEYILFEGLNNSDLDVQRLAKFVRSVPSKVNIIPFHDISFTNLSEFASTLKPAGKESINLFVSKLRDAGVNAFVRTSSGEDIDAACGQLAYSDRIKKTEE